MLIRALVHARRNDRMAHGYLVVTSNPDFRAEFPLLLAALRICENRCPPAAHVSNAANAGSCSAGFIRIIISCPRLR